MLKQFFGQQILANPEQDPRFSQRPIRVHSLTPLNEPNFFRLAFEVTTPPGPYSLQFLLLRSSLPLAEVFTPGTETVYVESRNGARTRGVKLPTGEWLAESR